MSERAWGHTAAARAGAHAGLILALLAALVLALGIVKLRLDPPAPDFNWENRWWQIGVSLARGEGYRSCKAIYFPYCGPGNDVTAMREPLPVLIYALIARLTGESLPAAAYSVVLANVGVLLLVYALARRLADRPTALLAAGLWAVYLAPLRLYYNLISGDLWATLGLMAGLFFFVRALQTATRRDWLLAGLCLGLGILSRSAVLIVALALSAGLLLCQHPPGGSRWRAAGGFTLAWALTMAPWVARNTLAFGRPVVGSTLAGYYLLRQSSVLPSDEYARFVSGGEFLPYLHQILAARPDLRGSENEAEMDGVYRQEALRRIAAHPARYLAASLARLPMLWFNWGVNEVYGKSTPLLERLIALQHALFLALGMVGVVRHHRLPIWPLALSILAFTALYLGVMAHLPYIVPVVAPLVVVGALSWKP